MKAAQPALSDQILQENADVFDAMINHRFVRDIRAGTLPPHVFDAYLVYEGSFVETAISIFGYGVARATDMGHRRWLIGVLDALANQQIAYFERTFAARDIAPGRFDLHQPDVQAFRDTLTHLAETGSYADILTAMFAAEWMYSTWCSAAAGGTITDPELREWVGMHADPAFCAQAQWLRAAIDHFGNDMNAAEAARQSAIFRRVMQLEISFHAAPYQQTGTAPA